MSVVSTTLMHLPADRLADVQAEFDRKPQGLRQHEVWLPLGPLTVCLLSIWTPTHTVPLISFSLPSSSMQSHVFSV